MNSKDHQGDDSELKPHIKLYVWCLVCLPVVPSLGFFTPFYEQSQLFRDGGWWKSLTLQQQILTALLGVAMWIATVTVVALLLSLFSRRWRQKFWLPAARGLRGAISWLGLRLVSRKDLNRLVEQELQARAKMKADAGPPKGSRTGLAGEVAYGDISTHEDLYSPDLSVVGRSTGLMLGKLVPSRGNQWEVHYGHVEQRGIQPQFVTLEKLGRVAEPCEGVELLRQRDLRESSDIQRTS